MYMEGKIMSNVPKYEQIIQYIKTLIENGSYKPDDQIASEKELAKTFNVSRETVRKALEKLTFEGYLYKIQGVGTFVSSLLNGSHGNKSKSEKIGIILPISHEYLSFEILSGIEKAYLDTKYEPFVQFIDSNPSIINLKMKYIFSAEPKGFIILPTRELIEDRNFKELLKTNIPVVFVDKTINDIEKPIVQSDNYNGAYQITEEIIKKFGINSAMFFSAEEFCISSVRERYNGMADACNKYNIPVYKEIVGKTEMDKAINKCLKYHVDTIFCANDIVAISTLTALQVRGFSIPQKMKLYGFDDRPISENIYPKLTTVRQPFKEIGEVAAKYLISIIEGKQENKYLKITLPVEIVWRDSVGNNLQTNVRRDKDE